MKKREKSPRRKIVLKINLEFPIAILERNYSQVYKYLDKLLVC